MVASPASFLTTTTPAVLARMQHQQQQQQPTLRDVRIRSVDDVHRIFFAVHSGILDIITRRLDVSERQALDSGHLYVFEDRGQHAVTGIGIERFTEGRHWSASRVRDASISRNSALFISPVLTYASQEFLFYYEKWKPPRNQSSGARTGKCVVLLDTLRFPLLTAPSFRCLHLFPGKQKICHPRAGGSRW